MRGLRSGGTAWRTREDLEDAVQHAHLVVLATGDMSRAPRAADEWLVYWDRGGITNDARGRLGGIGEWPSERDEFGHEWLATNQGNWRVIPTPRQAAGDYEPTGRPVGRPPKRAPVGAPGKLLKAAGIHPFPDGMAELRSLVRGGRKGRDHRLVKAVVECQAWGAAELARLLGCSSQAINAILREHRSP